MAIDLDELEKLSWKAFPAPWSALLGGYKGNYFVEGIEAEGREVKDFNAIVCPETPFSIDDAEFITALRNAAPELFKELRELRAWKEKVTPTLTYVHQCMVDDMRICFDDVEVEQMGQLLATAAVEAK